MLKIDVHYGFVVKDNQGQLLEAIHCLLDDSDEMRWMGCDHHKAVGRDHSRIEIRECWTTSGPKCPA